MSTLFLPGAGALSIPLLGALQYIHEYGGLAHIRRYVCFSFGSLVCTALSLGHIPKDILKLFARSELQRMHVCQAVMTKCNSTMRNDIRQVVPDDMTFAMHFRSTGMALEVICLNVNLKHKIFSFTATPDALVSDAILIISELIIFL